MSDSLHPTLPCLCAALRRTSRALTRLYEQALRPLGIRATQFTILQVLARSGETSQGRLGRILAMNSTTLTRTLRIMIRRGWISERRGEDRRERWLRLDHSGERQFRRALPAWEAAQSRLRGSLGPREWEELMQLATRATKTAFDLGGTP